MVNSRVMSAERLDDIALTLHMSNIAAMKEASVARGDEVDLARDPPRWSDGRHARPQPADKPILLTRTPSRLYTFEFHCRYGLGYSLDLIWSPIVNKILRRLRLTSCYCFSRGACPDG